VNPSHVFGVIQKENADLIRRVEALQAQLEKEQSARARESDGLVFKIDDRLVLKNPTPQTALDIFKGTWLSRLPGEFAQYEAGHMSLFDDERVLLGAQVLGAIEGKSILDLGPLEGGQAYVLAQMGARSVVSVEANSLLYLKCLVAKEILGMHHVHFLCGDAIEYLKNTAETFDMCVASGILYHMTDPVELLWLISRKTDKILIWTHYFDDRDSARNKLSTFNGEINKEFHGTSYTYYRQEYGVSFKTNIYCGGTAQHSSWMSKDGILTALREFGYEDIKMLQDGDSINGPFMLVAARKESTEISDTAGAALT
jgi:SAM-dependent methyltransferase